jgi:hypothetical protein
MDVVKSVLKRVQAIMKSGHTEKVMLLLKGIDRKGRIRKTLRALKASQVRVAVAAMFMETLADVTGQMSQDFNNTYWKMLHDQVVREKNKFGPSVVQFARGAPSVLKEALASTDATSAISSGTRVMNQLLTGTASEPIGEETVDERYLSMDVDAERAKGIWTEEEIQQIIDAQKVQEDLLQLQLKRFSTYINCISAQVGANNRFKLLSTRNRAFFAYRIDPQPIGSALDLTIQCGTSAAAQSIAEKIQTQFINSDECGSDDAARPPLFRGKIGKALTTMDEDDEGVTCLVAGADRTVVHLQLKLMKTTLSVANNEVLHRALKNHILEAIPFTDVPEMHAFFQLQLSNASDVMRKDALATTSAHYCSISNIRQGQLQDQGVEWFRPQNWTQGMEKVPPSEYSPSIGVAFKKLLEGDQKLRDAYAVEQSKLPEAARKPFDESTTKEDYYMRQLNNLALMSIFFTQLTPEHVQALIKYGNDRIDMVFDGKVTDYEAFVTETIVELKAMFPQVGDSWESIQSLIFVAVCLNGTWFQGVISSVSQLQAPGVVSLMNTMGVTKEVQGARDWVTGKINEAVQQRDETSKSVVKVAKRLAAPAASPAAAPVAAVRQ